MVDNGKALRKRDKREIPIKQKLAYRCCYFLDSHNKRWKTDSVEGEELRISVRLWGESRATYVEHVF